MRALAAIVALTAWFLRSYAHEDHLPRALLSVLGINDKSPVHRLLTCGQTLGPSKCLSAFSVWRAERATENFENEEEPLFDVRKDAQEFSWEKYSNRSEEQLYSQLCDGTEKLLRYRSLSLAMVPGYSFELESKGNGTLSVDVLKNDEAASGRSKVKKLQKKFYNIVPFLMIPGLIMSAILPFVLPALKLMVVGVGMLNNMALSGAVFTLLRNNAFSDHYEKKVIYVNEGYKNEKHSPQFLHEVPLEDVDVEYSASDVHRILDSQIAVDKLHGMEYPTNTEWINEYYGNGDAGPSKVRRSQTKKIRIKTKL